MSYDDKFYESIRGTTIRSAEIVVPIVLTHLSSIRYRVNSMVDVGGGQGWWAQAFNSYGIRALCMDGAYVKNPVAPFERVDLERPLVVSGRYDLAVCLEVGEHLSKQRAQGLVDELCRFAPVVLFSAAIPDQGGENHINEQWPGYWLELFNRFGFIMSGYLRELIWDDTAVASWYRQNLMLAVHLETFDFLGYPKGFFTDVPPASRIHPATGNPRLKEIT